MMWSNRAGQKNDSQALDLQQMDTLTTAAGRFNSPVFSWDSFSIPEAVGLSNMVFEIDDGKGSGPKIDDQEGHGYKIDDTVMMSASSCRLTEADPEDPNRLVTMRWDVAVRVNGYCSAHKLITVC